MFNLIPFNKKNELTSREDFFNQVFDQFFREDFFAPFTTTGSSFHVDLKETNDSYMIKADLPGIQKGDITIHFENDYLTISAKRNDETEIKDGNYLRRERRFGEFSRSFYIRNVRDENIDAEFTDGVLTITLPKRENNATINKTIPIR
ncbi:heat shock protein Hsp18 [Sporomusa acidovorans]|uniref:18 kDa heat shock protein n=1 Tax=Sporomusa acidovorans (strain ATCC 49682 / DSM 3132 / Mol) TaxID=1123286 RepID=A0ABZ3J2P9_SPOA4|nr:heat shock protein Hsp18 [Sporomusa acidovorans]OZC19730.1 18 kDa heat shock protein [Sporomusa acidovorans DSM 3132]SDF76118.1 HSP20 family protein [Sporomusa acidovorans]